MCSLRREKFIFHFKYQSSQELSRDLKVLADWKVLITKMSYSLMVNELLLYVYLSGLKRRAQ